ncbi:MAG TPA: glycoside hydrolase family 18 protein [Candidatus Saccharicenans sp.]|nr:glycoside hydrolase family 18 protein [Candidatus Saccharicenans sp.]
MTELFLANKKRVGLRHSSKKYFYLIIGLALIILVDSGQAGQKLGRNFSPQRPPQAGQARAKKVIIGYYPSEKRAVVDYRQIEFDYLTHLAEAFAWPDREGNLIVNPDFIYPELLTAAHQKGVKVIMSLGGWGNCAGFPPMAASAEKRSRFISQVLDFCLLHGYDGVDLDWEFVSNEQEKDSFSALVKELNAVLKAQSPPLLLTMAAPAGPYWGRWINFEELHPYFDFISFMTYDYHGPWTDHAGHNSPLYTCLNDPCGSIDDTFSYALIRGIPLKKILLGIPFYGRSFEAAGLYKSAANSQYYVYSEIKKLMASGWKYNWDNCAEVPYLLSPSKKTLLSFDDKRSIQKKGQYLLEKKVAGFIIWEITGDVVNGRPELLPVVYQSINYQGER